ncbi:MAG: hypothetical protein HYU36_06000 [Planctomycetes bacterium]|nr:hypothetical protein [Planctomycetota bacterium]
MASAWAVEERDFGFSPATRCSLRLYVAGICPHSARAIMMVREFCERSLQGLYTLEVYDIYQQPERAQEDGVLVIPTLVRCQPLPRRRFACHLLSLERLLAGARDFHNPNRMTLAPDGVQEFAGPPIVARDSRHNGLLKPLRDESSEAGNGPAQKDAVS